MTMPLIILDVLARYERIHGEPASVAQLARFSRIAERRVAQAYTMLAGYGLVRLAGKSTATARLTAVGWARIAQLYGEAVA